MRPRRVQLLLPDAPSDAVLLLAQTIKASIASRYTVVLRHGEEGEDDDLTPVEIPLNEPSLIIQISERDLQPAR